MKEISSDNAQSILDKASSMARSPLEEVMAGVSQEASHLVETLIKFNPG